MLQATGIYVIIIGASSKALVQSPSVLPKEAFEHTMHALSPYQ